MDGKTDPPSSSVFIRPPVSLRLHPLFLDIVGSLKRRTAGKKRGGGSDNIAPSCYASLFSSHLSPPLALPFLSVSPSFSSAAPVKTQKRMWDGEEDGETKRWMEGGIKRGGRGGAEFFEH